MIMNGTVEDPVVPNELHLRTPSLDGAHPVAVVIVMLVGPKLYGRHFREAIEDLQYGGTVLVVYGVVSTVSTVQYDLWGGTIPVLYSTPYGQYPY
jgi:hypothetical protein